MQISITALSFALTPAIAQHVEERIRQSLGAALPQVGAASVRLDDINGDRGGEDKRCRIVLTLRPSRTIIAEGVDADLYAAIDRAALRAREAARRQIKRRRTLGREYANRGYADRYPAFTAA